MSSTWKDFARRVGLGRAAYTLWHQPRALLNQSRRAGGPVHQWLNARGQRAMLAAAGELPVLRAPLLEAPELAFLTGRRFWYQTAFCLHTLQAHTQRSFRAAIHDDGSLDEDSIAQLRHLFPHVEVHRRPDNDARMAELLPPSKFPTLHGERRRAYPNFLKLTDVHAGRAGWRLVLDSDMLFFRRPEFLLAWLAAPDRPLYLLDVGDAYGYPLTAMSALAGATVPSRVNVGFCGLNSSEMDWDRLEHWARTLLHEHGSHYYLEQALSAMLFAGGPGAAAPANDYKVMPTDDECRAPTAVLQHYVDTSKRGYFRHAWRIALARAAAISSAP
jgi:hypothetical protein